MPVDLPSGILQLVSMALVNPMNLNDSSEQKSINIWILVALVVVTVAVAAILWQLVGTLEGTSSQVHKYIAKSKEPESNMVPLVNSLPNVSGTTAKPTTVNKPPAVLKFEEGLAQSKNHDLTGAAQTFNAALEMAQKLPPDQEVTVENANVSPKHFLAMLYSSRADCFVYQQEWKKAVEDYTRAIKLNPEEPTLYADRANCYSKMGKGMAAVQDFKSMSQHDSSLPLP
jgi:tetratricopeptide (TPR) repeat protein